MIKELKYTGLTNAPDDYNCADGDLAAVVNLVNENGNLKPFVHPETIMTIQGVLCCVHKGSNYENYITLDEGNLYSQTKTGDRVLIIDNVGDVSKIEVIGNTLIVISNQPIKYILYKDQAYKYLGEKPPMPDMSFRFTGAFKEIPTNTNFSNKVKALVPNPPDNGSSPIAPENVTSLTNLVFGHLNPKIAALIDNNKCPFPFFIRYALRLYDGTVTQHSAPIFCRETVLTMPYEYRRLKRKCEEYVGLTLSSWDKEWGEFLNDFSLSLRWGGYNGLWTDIVKSIDIFMSEQIYTYDQSGEIKKVISRTETIGIGVTINNIYLDIAYHDDKKIDKDISETGRFYKIYSIPTSGIFPDFKNQDVSRPYTTDDFNSLLPKGVIKNLQLQELMEDEYRSHHSLSAATSYVYNNRLHLANITQRIFKGFDLNEMSILNSRYIWEKWGDGFIDICLKINGDTVIKRQEINFDSLRSAYVYYPDSRAYEIRIYKNNTAVTPNWHVYYTIPLKSHPYLNGSYYLEPNLGGIIDNIKSITGTITIPPEPPGVDNVSNKLQVSESGNPFVFKAQHMYTIGNSDLCAIVSSTKALSQGQFGQFPLYVLSGEGIWAMEVSNTGTYSSRQMVARDVCNNPDSILQLDGAVAFTSDKGIMLMQGSEVICISSALGGTTFKTEQMVDFDRIASATGTEAMITAINGSVPFSEFIKGCSMAYDYPNSRILIINESQPYAYVYNIESQSWATISGDYIKAVNNYPDSYLIDKAGGVSNISAIISNDDPTIVNGIAISRPVKLDSPDMLKTISSVVHGGQFIKDKVKSVLYGSRDGVTYVPIASSTDSRIRRIHGSPYRFFRVVLITDMSRKESISGTTIEYENKYANKLR